MPDDFFVESSALVKRYKSEPGSDYMDAIMSGQENRLFFLNITILEVQKLIYRLRFHPQSAHSGIEASIDEQTFRNLLSQSSRDFLQMKVVQLTQAMIHRAASILPNYWIPSSVDLLQVAAFLETRTVYPMVQFVCADERLNEVVRRYAPSAVINPATSSTNPTAIDSIRNTISNRAAQHMCIIHVG